MRKLANKKVNFNEKLFDSKLEFNQEDIINKKITSEPNNFSLH